MAMTAESVQNVTVLLASGVSTNDSATLTGTAAQLVPFVTAEVGKGSDNGDIHAEQLCTVQIVGSVARVTRGSATNASTVAVSIMVVEMPAAYAVEEDVPVMTGTSQTTVHASNSDVDRFAVCSSRNDTRNDDFNDHMVEFRFTGATAGIVERGASAGTQTCVVYSVSCASSEFSVDHVGIDLVAVASNTGTVSVTTGTAFIVGSYQSTHTTDDVRSGVGKAVLTSGTVVTVTRNFTNANLLSQIMAVDMDGGEVSRGVIAWALNEPQDTATAHTATDANFIGVCYCFSGQPNVEGDGNVSQDVCGAYARLTISGTTVTGDRYDGSTATDNLGNSDWQAVEFDEETGGGGGLSIPVAYHHYSKQMRSS